MILIPAIDLKNNNCVRLKKGDIKKNIIFCKNSILAVNKWLNCNVRRIHIVDLDGAIEGKPKNILTIKSIMNDYNNLIEMQIGGGVRNIETIEYYFDLGFSYIVLGTKAITDLNFLEEVCKKYENKIILGLDLKNSRMAINGWKDYYNINLINFLKKINEYPLESVIYTDINRDGMLKGLNILSLIKISKYLKKNFIISGGLSKKEDIKNIFCLKNNLLGIICGTSIYSGILNIKNLISKINYFNKICIN